MRDAEEKEGGGGRGGEDDADRQKERGGRKSGAGGGGDGTWCRCWRSASRVDTVRPLPLKGPRLKASRRPRPPQPPPRHQRAARRSPPEGDWGGRGGAPPSNPQSALVRRQPRSPSPKLDALSLPWIGYLPLPRPVATAHGRRRCVRGAGGGGGAVEAGGRGCGMGQPRRGSRAGARVGRQRRTYTDQSSPRFRRTLQPGVSRRC